MIEIHPTAKISIFSDIEDSVRGTRVIISEMAVIDSFVKIKPAGGIGDVFIGPETVINSGCVFYSGNGIFIGHGVAVAANCTFAATNHEFEIKNIPIRKQGFRPSKGGIVIENEVWIGANCVILDGAVIGEGCVVAAASVVRGVLEPYGIYGGNPITKLGERR